MHFLGFSKGQTEVNFIKQGNLTTHTLYKPFFTTVNGQPTTLNFTGL
jgi:hypothetical protein